MACRSEDRGESPMELRMIFWLCLVLSVAAMVVALAPLAQLFLTEQDGRQPLVQQGFIDESQHLTDSQIFLHNILQEASYEQTKSR